MRCELACGVTGCPGLSSLLRPSGPFGHTDAGSGPPGTNYQVMKKAFDEGRPPACCAMGIVLSWSDRMCSGRRGAGWGAVIAKTVSLEAGKVVNVTPRWAALARLLHHHGTDAAARPAVAQRTQLPTPRQQASSGLCRVPARLVLLVMQVCQAAGERWQGGDRV